MPRLNSPSELEKLRGEIKAKRDPNKPCISISSGTCGRARGSEEVYEAFKGELKRRELEEKIDLRRTGCLGFCEREPIAIIYPEEIYYFQLKPEDAAEVVQSTKEKKVAERLLYTDPVTGEKIIRESEIPFYKNQERIVFGPNRRIDPKSIEDYIALGGYSALAKALSQMTPEQVSGEVKQANLRGRGGGGFPAGRKWETTKNAPGEPKYVIVNCDEGDPGAFMDRSLMEGNPHSVLEGLIIGAYATGSHKGFVYVRQEYPLAVENLEIAIKQAEEYGLLGENILGSGFDFRVTVHRGAGAFVSGESSALMTAIEGRVGEPRPKYIRTAVKGIWDRPSNLNNVETWANVPLIINNGADWFKSIGTEGSKGTKIFSLVGKVNNTGLVEVPMGITLRDIIYKIGGGIPGGKEFKGVQTGGPSGGVIPEQYLDTPVDFDELTKLGSMMGSGGMIVMDEATCMVDTAKYFIDFLKDESCGKCTPCREGIKQMLEILTDITEGKGREEELGLLEELAAVMQDSSLCALGKTAPNPVWSTLKYFREEYEDHIKKRCPAMVCGKIVVAPCRYTCPAGVDVPRYNRFISRGMFAEALAVVREKNPFPSVCGHVCPHPCEGKCRRGEIDEPIAIKALKRFVAEQDDGRWKERLKSPIPTDKKIAIIGSGPAGLTAAYYLTRLGHSVTIFEAASKPGGMMRKGIPQFILPQEVLDKEIEEILSFGIELKLDSPVENIGQLLNDGYDAVLVAVGLQEGKKLPIPGNDLQGVLIGLDLLRDVNEGKEVKLGQNVLVLGGGGVACDVARTVKRLGVPQVAMACLESQETIPAPERDIQGAREEGIKIFPSRSFKQVLGENGRVKGVECLEVKWMKFDEEGRLHLETFPDSEHILEADTVIFAIGQGLKRQFVEGNELELTRRRTIKASAETLETNLKGVFVSGDALTGPASVVQAVATGRQAASSIDKYLGGKGEIDETLAAPEDLEMLPEIEEGEKPRVQMPRSPLSERLSGFAPVELGFNEEMALEEAKRCLRCDLEV